MVTTAIIMGLEGHDYGCPGRTRGRIGAEDTIESLIQAIILGVVQGATEFLPVSSSGHLILTSALFGWEDQGLGFDVGLHLGTLFVVGAYFWRDWLGMLRSTAFDVSHGRLLTGARQPTRLLAMIVGATVPAGLVGLMLDDWISSRLREPWIVATALGVIGLAMWFVDRVAPLRRRIEDMDVRDALIVGLAQTLALVPGVSRSGVTLIAGLGRGLTRADAARFGFLLGTPTIAGAAVLEFPSVASEGQSGLWRLLLGMCVSAAVGFLVVSQLMRFLRTRTLVPFAIYRIGLACLVFGVLVAGVR
ncbi:MAG: undecaprenyl-diphosphate phosphatase [Dehalococcoidia bacterium]|nr:undecaprenyl-diphosphate phosphatase [Dehalococcoidia bacterium]